MPRQREHKRIVWLIDLDDEKHIDGIIKEFVKYEMESHTEPIYLFIMSIGGYLNNAFKLKHFFSESITAPIVTVGVAEVCSAANTIMACGDLRIALTDASFLIHGVSDIMAENSSFSSQDYLKSKKELDQATEEFLKSVILKKPHHVRPCKITLKSLKKRIKNDKEYFFNAKIALRLGLVDAIARSISEVAAIAEQSPYIVKINKKVK